VGAHAERRHLRPVRARRHFPDDNPHLKGEEAPGKDAEQPRGGTQLPQAQEGKSRDPRGDRQETARNKQRAARASAHSDTRERYAQGKSPLYGSPALALQKMDGPVRCLYRRWCSTARI